MDFENAISSIKIGGALARRAVWGHGSYIYLVDGSTFTVSRKPLNVIFPEGTSIKYAPHIDYCFRVGDINHSGVWAPTMEDMFATDWSVQAITSA
jgi:hypothetical protein